MQTLQCIVISTVSLALACSTRDGETETQAGTDTVADTDTSTGTGTDEELCPGVPEFDCELPEPCPLITFEVGLNSGIVVDDVRCFMQAIVDGELIQQRLMYDVDGAAQTEMIWNRGDGTLVFAAQDYSDDGGPYCYGPEVRTIDFTQLGECLVTEDELVLNENCVWDGNWFTQVSAAAPSCPM